MADVKTRILLRSDTKANWASHNPTLLKGEFGIEFDPSATDTNKVIKVKIGDGLTAWEDLAYFADFASAIEALEEKVGSTSVANQIATAIAGLADIYQTKLPDGEVGKFLTTDDEGNLTWESIQAGGVWGSITGDIADQEDLQEALDAKQDEITTTNKLDAALIEEATNKQFITATEKQKISDAATSGDVTSAVGQERSAREEADTQLSNAIAGKVDKVEGYSLIADEKITKLDGIEEDAQVNVLEGVQLEGVDLTIDENKKVNITGLATESDLGLLQGRVVAIESQEDTWNDKYTKDETDALLELKANIADVYAKSETYNKTEVDNLIAAIKTIKYETVEELPTADAEHEFNTSKTVYMMLDSSATGQDVYDEFICINKGTTTTPAYAWEKIGSTRIDLSNYYTKFETYNKTEIDTALADKQDNLTAGTNVEITENNVINVQEDETTVKLSEDLYTYTNIGKITGASQTNPVKVASEGDSLKSVFNAILGTEVDVNPTITDNSANTMSQSGTGAKSAAEHGASFAAANPTVTFTVATGGVAQYGLKTLTHDTYNKRGANTAFNYPIKTLQYNGSDYNIRVEVASSYQDIITVTAGTEVARNGNYIYCLLDNNNKVTLKLALPAGTYTQNVQTLCGQLKAYVEYNAATYQGETVIAFYTYLKADYTQKLTTTAKTSSSSTACTCPKGTLYPYYGNTTLTTAPTSGLTKSTDSACYTNGVDVTMAADGYIWFALPVTKTKIQQYALGSWNDMATTSAGTVTYTLASGGTYTYNMYRTTAQQGAGNTLQVRMN